MTSSPLHEHRPAPGEGGGSTAGSTPRVSIVVAAYRADPVQFAAMIRSALAQTFADFELLVLEDPPHGVAGDAVAAAADQRCRHIANERPVDLATARNQLLQLARGELVAILDADDVAMPDRLQRQVAFLDAHPEVTVLGAAIELVDSHDRTLGYHSFPTAHAEIARALRRRNPLAHPTVMFRRAAVLAVGGYRTLPNCTCDDYDLWSRLALAGARLGNLPQPLLRYRVHAGATKARQLRATLRDTLFLKRAHWAGQLDLGDRLRMLGERLLLLLPPAVVMALFLRTQVSRTPPTEVL